jgi:hypothetical protein
MTIVHRFSASHACAVAAAVLLLAATVATRACELHSAYDVTVTPEALLFDRVSGPARRIEMRDGRLTDRGKVIALGRSDRDRIVRYERVARSLVPRVRKIGARAADLAAAAVREQAAASSPHAAASPELNARLDARVRELKARIAKSNTSSEWRGPAFNRYAAALLADVVPLIGGDIANAALEATLRGDFGKAAALAGQASGVRAALEDRLRARLGTLKPQLDALCPSLRTLDALEAAVTARLADGTRLDLVQVSGR